MLNSFKLPSNFSNVSNRANISGCSYVAAQLKFLFQPSGRDKQSIDSRGVFHQNGDSTQTGKPIEEEKNQELLLSDVPSAETSTSKTNKINMLLQKLYHARHIEKQTKIHNAQLIERNMELYDRSKEIIEKHKKIVERNSMLMKENARLYRNLRILRLKMKESAGTEAKSLGLETLAEIATTLEEEIPVETHQEQERRSTRLKGSASKRS